MDIAIHKRDRFGTVLCIATPNQSRHAPS